MRWWSSPSHERMYLIFEVSYSIHLMPPASNGVVVVALDGIVRGRVWRERCCDGLRLLAHAPTNNHTAAAWSDVALLSLRGRMLQRQVAGGAAPVTYMT